MCECSVVFVSKLYDIETRRRRVGELLVDLGVGELLRVAELSGSGFRVADRSPEVTTKSHAFWLRRLAVWDPDVGGAIEVRTNKKSVGV